jgi:hypothetical protein
MVNNLYVQVVKLGIVFCLLLSYKIIITNYFGTCTTSHWSHTPHEEKIIIFLSFVWFANERETKNVCFYYYVLMYTDISNLFIEKVTDIVVIFHTFYGPKLFPSFSHSWREKELWARAGFFSLQILSLSFPCQNQIKEINLEQ